jgi:hypothetical protein
MKGHVKKELMKMTHSITEGSKSSEKLLKKHENLESQVDNFRGPYFVMPHEASPVMVISAVEAIEGMGAQVDLSTLIKRFNFQNPQPNELISALKVAQELKLLTIERTRISLTDLGIGFAKASEAKIAIMRAGLSRIEPFRTALYLLSSRKRKFVSATEIATMILPTGFKANEIESMLTVWGLSSGLLDYSGKSDQFKLHERRFNAA